MSRQKTAVAAAFVTHVKAALDHFNDPAWLGTHSPLARPYLLGDRLNNAPDPETHRGRGAVVQVLLLETAAALEDGQSGSTSSGKVHEEHGTSQRATMVQDAHQLKLRLEHGSRKQQLLYWSFFYQPELTELQLTQEMVYSIKLNIGRAQYFRDRKAAINLLSTALIRALKPALRQTRPTPPVQLVGRDDAFARCVAGLRKYHVVALIGKSGLGKTALGAALAAQDTEWLAFWYACRPGLNDQIPALLFAFCHFLAQRGANSAWLQLLADDYHLTAGRVPALIHQDLDSLAPRRVLICIDDVDLLRPDELAAHADMLAFLKSLRDITPLLLLGQNVPVVADVVVTLEGLESTDVSALLAHAAVPLSEEDRVRLQHITKGNPRLLELLVGLHRSGEPLSTLLEDVTHEVTLDMLVTRALRRLNEAERQVLDVLAIVRRPVPREVWDPIILNLLSSRHLVHDDGRGGVGVPPPLQGLITEQLDSDSRRAAHLDAAAIRTIHGEHTAAAYHYLHAAQARIALWLWYEHKDAEIDQGQASPARTLLRHLDTSGFADDDRRLLAVALSELALLDGDLEGHPDLRNPTLWPSTSPLTAIARRLEGHLAEVQSQFERAERAYREGLYTIERLSNEQAVFRKNLGWVALRQKDLDQAWHEALLARYEALNLQGYVQEEMRHYSSAQDFYEEALAIAEQLGYQQGLAKTHNNVGALHALQGHTAEANTHLLRADELFAQIGNRAMVASVKVNQALMYNQANQPRDALPYAHDALELFTQLQQPFGITVSAQNLAEAYLSLGNVIQAKRYAQVVIQAKDAALLPDGLRVLGEVHLAQGDMQAAEQTIQQSIDVAYKNHDRFLEAYAYRSLGRVYAAQQGRSADAVRAYSTAVRLFREQQLDDEVKRTILLLEG